MQDFSNVVVVDNLPAVPDSKIAKLTEVVKKIFAGVSGALVLSAPITLSGA